MTEYREIPVELVDRDRNQPRQHFDEAALEELAASIRAHGVIQPIEVEATADGRYRLHHGERRWRASKLAGRESIPAIVAAARTSEEALVRGLLENLHREDLNPIEEGRVYQGLIDLGWSRTRIAREMGRGLAVIAGRLEWLKIEPEVQRLVALGHLPRDGRLAAALRVLPPEAQVSLAQKMAAQALSLEACLRATKKAAEKIAQRREAVEKGRARHAEAAAKSNVNGRLNGHGANGSGPNGHGPGWGAPMLDLARVNGTAAVVVSVEAAAEAMCRACSLKPKGDVIPAWELVVEAARRTCAECQRRDGPANLTICRQCPGVEMVRRLVKGVEAKA